MSTLRVMVVGAAGRMGREVVRAVSAQDDMAVVAAVDCAGVGEDAAALAGAQAPAVPITDSLESAVAGGRPEVGVDFTVPAAVMGNARLALAARLPYVIGATGLTDSDLKELAALSDRQQTPVLVAPNFAIGAVLMMQFAARAARYFDAAEIIELHHDAKVDAPSGTALITAKLMAEAPESHLASPASPDHPSRGLRAGKVQIHSVRLPGLVAHQEVIFGGLGQTLTIRHDSFSRESFMPGVLLALRRVRGLTGLQVGLQAVLC
jgi:4-hydroxy-tetrahydrodipicolinate reductase